MSDAGASESTPVRPHLGELDAGALFSEAIDENVTSWPEGYHRIRLLGAGGMGEVFLAKDTALNREVAIKLVHPELVGEPMVLDRLEREARIMSAINHPGIVSIHQLVPVGEDGLAIVMEFVNGGSLRDALITHGKSFPIPEALRIGRETAEAIHAAHNRGIVHRDLKPENILLGSDGRVKVTDFGLAAPLDPLATRLTMAGTTAGTIDYMAPERHTETETNQSADLYSLGVITYEMLTGQLPRGNFDPPRTIRPEISRSVSDAVMTALRSDPKQRHASMPAFASELHLGQTRKAKAVIALVVIFIATLTGIFAPLLRTGKSSPTAGKETTMPPRAAPQARTASFHPPEHSSVNEEWRSLFPTLDPARDRLSGGWRTTPDGLLSDDQICILRLSDEIPESYEVRVRFTRLEGVHSIALFLRGPNGIGSVDIDGWGQGLCGLQAIDGRDLRSGNSFTQRLENGRPYELHVIVSPTDLQVRIDGETRFFTPITGRLSIVPPWNWSPSPSVALALGSYQSSTLFSSIEWRPRAP